MMKSINTIIFKIFLGIASQLSFLQYVIAEEGNENYQIVSIYQLIVTPERFLNKKFSVTGYYGGLHNHLYLNRLSAENRINFDFLIVEDLTKSRKNSLQNSFCSDRDVAIKAKFVKREQELGLVEVEEVRDAKNYKICWSKSMAIDGVTIDGVRIDGVRVD